MDNVACPLVKDGESVFNCTPAVHLERFVSGDELFVAFESRAVHFVLCQGFLFVSGNSVTDNRQWSKCYKRDFAIVCTQDPSYGHCTVDAQVHCPREILQRTCRSLSSQSTTCAFRWHRFGRDAQCGGRSPQEADRYTYLDFEKPMSTCESLSAQEFNGLSLVCVRSVSTQLSTASLLRPNATKSLSVEHRSRVSVSHVAHTFHTSILRFIDERYI